MTYTKKVLQVVVLSLAVAGAAVPANAQTGPAAPKAPAAAPQAAQDRYVVGQAKPPEVPGAPMLNLTLEDAIQRALDRNLDLKVQKLNPQIQDYQLQQTRAFYRPTFSGTVRYNNQKTTNTSTLEAASTVTTTGQTYNTSASMPVRWYGGNMQLQFNNSRTFTNSTINSRNPNLTANLQFSYTQPILHNFKTDSNRTSLKTQEIARQVADIDLRTSLLNTVANVRNAYWDLRAAIENIEIQRRAVDLARSFVEQNRTKVEVGTMAQIDVIQAESQQANAELSLAQAESTWRTAELAFKRLIASSADDDAYKSTINPTDLPAVAPPVVDIQAAIAAAMAQRTDLAKTRKNLESSALTIAQLQNATLPDLNLVGGYTSAGVGGPTIKSGVVTPGGYSDALNQLFGLDTPTWNITANFSYPLGMAAAKASLARTRLTLEQSQTQLKVQELTVATSVTNAGLQVQNTYKSLLAAQKARELAERQADAEQTKFEVGMSTNFTVVQQQQAMTSARTAELRALLTYIKALIEFERVQNSGS
ncbi:MAG: TolC family protein [Acidobacteria bacterium]|nr:MAG: TolC family protein [Acidobacteriota bacterium]